MAQEDKSIPQVVTELKQLTIDYAKQETVDPLKNLGRDVGFGVAGSILIGAGLLFLSVATLRFLQTETDTRLTGNWNWVPYVGAMAWLVLGLAFCLFKVTRKERTDR